MSIDRLNRLSRRQFFARSATAAGSSALTGLFGGLVARSAAAELGGAQASAGYGDLRPAGNELALPPGFNYSVVSFEWDVMDDGFPVPKAMDGMAAFPLPNGNLLLIRNHEDSEAPNRLRPRPADSTSTTAGILNRVLNTHYGPRAFAYDAYCGGGTTSSFPPGQRRGRKLSRSPSGARGVQACCSLELSG